MEDRIARFVDRYGREGLRELLDSLAAGKGGGEIARRFGVTRQAVSLWRHTFGQPVTTYQIRPEVLAALDSDPPA